MIPIDVFLMDCLIESTKVRICLVELLNEMEVCRPKWDNYCVILTTVMLLCFVCLYIYCPI